MSHSLHSQYTNQALSSLGAAASAPPASLISMAQIEHEVAELIFQRLERVLLALRPPTPEAVGPAVGVERADNLTTIISSIGSAHQRSIRLLEEIEAKLAV